MASKWGGLKGKYPNTPASKMTEYGEDPDFLTKVNAKKDELREQWSGSLAGFMQEMDDARLKKAELAKEESRLNVIIEACSQLIMQYFEGQQIDKARSETLGRTFYTAIEPYPTIIDKEALAKHIEEHPELDNLWIINTQGVKALVKEYLEDGRDADIPACISVMLKTEIKSIKS